jgi:hypothetical protein
VAATGRLTNPPLEAAAVLSLGLGNQSVSYRPIDQSPYNNTLTEIGWWDCTSREGGIADIFVRLGWEIGLDEE